VIGSIAGPLWLRRNSFTESLYFLFGMLQMIYPLNTAVFIIFFCKIISIMVASLGRKKHFSKFNGKIGLENQIGQLKQSYLIIGELIEKINLCFGPVLLIFLTSTFVRLVNNLFFISILIYKKNISIPVLPLVFTSLVIFNISVLTFQLCNTASSIRRQVIVNLF